MSTLVQFKDVTKSFLSGKKPLDVLKGINFSISSGESVSICGQSGSGKTTLLNCLAGIEKPDTGSVFWNDKDIAHFPESELLKRRGYLIGFIFQAFYLIPELNLLDNVILPARVIGSNIADSKGRAMRYLDHLGLADRSTASVMELSGGERQRVAIARALINQPGLVLADEPTGNLDEHSAALVMEQLHQLVEMEEVSLVLVTHSKAYAKTTNRQLVLREGTLE